MSDLTTVKEQISREFGHLKIKDWQEIEAAKSPDGKLYQRFEDTVLSLPPAAQQNRCLAFRGIHAKDLDNICEDGYNNKMNKPRKQRGKKSQAKFMYFATNPDTAMIYCCSQKIIIVNELLLGRDRYYHKINGKIGLRNPYNYALPRFIFTLQ